MSCRRVIRSVEPGPYEPPGINDVNPNVFPDHYDALLRQQNRWSERRQRQWRQFARNPSGKHGRRPTTSEKRIQRQRQMQRWRRNERHGPIEDAVTESYDSDDGDWVECYECDGEGGFHDCGEDCCVCRDPEGPPWAPCPGCEGRGGWREAS
jgi:hypothetical protein